MYFLAKYKKYYIYEKIYLLKMYLLVIKTKKKLYICLKSNFIPIYFYGNDLVPDSYVHIH